MGRAGRDWTGLHVSGLYLCTCSRVHVHVSERGHALRGFIRRQIVLSGGGFSIYVSGTGWEGIVLLTYLLTYLCSCSCSCSIVHAVPRTRDPSFLPSFLPFLPSFPSFLTWLQHTKADDDDYDGGCMGLSNNVRQQASKQSWPAVWRGEETHINSPFSPPVPFLPSIR